MLTSRDTRKESQNPSVNIIYSVGLDHNAEMSYNKWSQKIKPFWTYFIEKNLAIWLAERILGPKHTNKLQTAWNKWINLLFLSVSNHM